MNEASKRRLFLGGLLFVIAASFAAYLHRPGDMQGYVEVGQAVLSRLDIYADTTPGTNTWPPFYSVACVPLALLSKVNLYLLRGVWISLIWVSILLLMRLIVKLGYGGGLDPRIKVNVRSLASPFLLIPLLFTLAYITSSFEYQQIDLILYALALGGLYLHSTGREPLGGMTLGAAAALKIMPVVFVPYLVYRRRWRAAFYTTAGATAFSLSPILVVGWGRFWHYVQEYHSVLPQKDWRAYNLNQSVYAMWDRILGHGMVPIVARGVLDLPMSYDPRVKLAWFLTLLAAMGFGLLCFRGQPRPGSRWELAEWGVVFIAAAIFGPVTWKHYLVILLLPNAVMYSAWRSADLEPRIRRVALIVLLLCFALSLSIMHTLLGDSLATRLETGSSVTIAALIMLGALLWFRSCAPRQDLS